VAVLKKVQYPYLQAKPPGISGALGMQRPPHSLGLAQALIPGIMQCRRIATFYECITTYTQKMG